MKEGEQLFWKFGKTFPKGTVLFREGEPGKEMFIIQSGRVRVRKKVGGEEKVLAELAPGEFFGEMALLEGLNRTATAEVMEDSRILVIAPDTFQGLIETHTAIAVKMLKKMASRLRALDEQMETLLLEAKREKT